VFLASIMINGETMASDDAIRITIQVRPDVARALQGLLPSSPEAEEVARAAAELGTVLEPIHPGVDDPHLETYFTVEVADPAAADRLLEEFGANPAIEAAYIKPSDAAP
jgi:hypothetical protein